MPSVHAQFHHILHCNNTVWHGCLYLVCQQGGTVVGTHLARSSRHDVPTSEVGLAGTQSSSSIYGSVVFDLTFINEVTKSDNILKNIEANLIDSCIEVIISLPDIRSHRLVHCIPSYFDSPDPTYLIPPPGTSQANTPPTIAILVWPVLDAKAHYLVAIVHSSLPEVMTILYAL